MAYSEKYKRILHRLGYYDYQHGLIYRHLNQDEGWNSHLYNCRKFILEAASIIKPAKITVLGSGWLLDLPLAELAEQTREIVLTDIVHPPDTGEQIRVLGNVKLSEEDATGGLIELAWQETSKLPFFKKLKTLENIPVPEYIPQEDPGMVISLNLLSQLDVLIVRYLRKKSSAGEDEYLTLRKEIQRKHIDFLRKHDSVLISDVTETFTLKNGEKKEEQTVVIPVPPGELRREWQWDFDLKGSDYYDRKSVLKVNAIMFRK